MTITSTDEKLPASIQSSILDAYQGRTILITGGTGYIGSWVVKGLLENKHTVRLTVRNKNHKEKYKYLAALAESSEGSLEIHEADLLKPGSFDEVAKG